jgi:ornithine decarboxylase
MRSSLQKVIATHASPQPFYIASPTAVAKQITAWRTHLPTVQPFYAVKSNPDKQVMKWLKTAGVNFDCASGREIDDAMAPDVGATAQSIIFANPHKTARDCAYAKTLGIEETVVDSAEEVEKIAKTGWRPRILIRLAVDDAASRSPFSIKFGAERSAWQEILSAIARNSLHFGGLSFHIGSASSDPTQYKRAIDTCKAFVQRTATPAETVDIGGGFLPDTFTHSATQIRASMEAWAQTAPHTAPRKWIAEPGRFFSSRSHTLYAPIISRKKGPGGVGWRYILDESVYGQFSCIVYDHARPYWLQTKDDNNDNSVGKREKGFLFGRTCDSIDLIAYSERMPTMNEGDWLCFPEMGSYTTASASEFNGYPKPKTYYQDEGWVETAPVDTAICFPVEAKSSVTLSTQKN